MPLAAAVVCPNPPLLVPDVASGAAPELDDLRDACDWAIDSIFAANPDLITIVGGASARRSFRPEDVGTFGPYGVSLAVALGGGSTEIKPSLPLSLTVGAWLLRDRPRTPVRGAEAIGFDLPSADCAAIGSALVGTSARVGLLVMGDGSACRGEKAPGYADPRAEDFDRTVVSALARADSEALAAIDPELATDLLASGRAAWQVLGGAAGLDPWRGEVLYDAAPYGVQYTVVTWTAP